MKKGSIVEGKICKLDNSGLYVDLGNSILGFLPKEQMNISKNKKLTEYFFIGYDIKSKILNKKKDYYTLSQKELSKDELKVKKNDILEISSLKKLKTAGNFKILVDKKDKFKNISKIEKTVKEEEKIILDIPNNYEDKKEKFYVSSNEIFDNLVNRLKSRGIIDED